jgi:hypothetical protein
MLAPWRPLKERGLALGVSNCVNLPTRLCIVARAGPPDADARRAGQLRCIRQTEQAVTEPVGSRDASLVRTKRARAHVTVARNA